MQSLRVKDLLETEVTLFVANNKDMTVLGAVLVDTVVEEPCIKPSSFSGMVADCGCPCQVFNQLADEFAGFVCLLAG